MERSPSRSRSKSPSRSPRRKSPNAGLFETLPNDVVGNIMSYMDAEQVANLKQTGKTMKQIVESKKNIDPTNVYYNYNDQVLRFKSKQSPIEIDVEVERWEGDLDAFIDSIGKKDSSKIKLNIRTKLMKRLKIKAPLSNKNDFYLSIEKTNILDKVDPYGGIFKIETSLLGNNDYDVSIIKYDTNLEIHLTYYKNTDKIEVSVVGITTVKVRNPNNVRTNVRRIKLSEEYLKFDMDAKKWMNVLVKELNMGQ